MREIAVWALVLAVLVGLACGFCALGIGPPPINTPTPTGVTP